MAAAHWITLTLLAALVSADMVLAAPHQQESQADMLVVQEAATLHNLITKFNDVSELLQRIKLVHQMNENVAKKKSMSYLQRMQGKQAEVLEFEDTDKNDKEKQEQEVERKLQELAYLATELTDVQALLTEIQERLMTATAQLCFNNLGVCCINGCG